MNVASMAPAAPTPPSGQDTRGGVTVPGWIDSLAAYRRWAHSDAYPESARASYLDGAILVDVSMEEFLTHNRVRFGFSLAIGNVLLADPKGQFVVDRMLLTNPTANLATEPDGLFFLWATMQSGALRLVPGKKRGYMELEGAPDMVLEIVSDSSVYKDTDLLRQLYWRAGVTEYWLVDARVAPERFEILRHTSAGYEATTALDDGWLASSLLGRQFRLTRQIDPLGHPLFTVDVR